MTGLLTAIAILSALVLLSSSTNLIAKATARDPNKRGSWGIARWTLQRDRALNPHERRWQTFLLSSRDNPARWTVLVQEIQRLEYLGSLPSSGTPPVKPDTKWLEASLSRIEKSLDGSASSTQSRSSIPDSTSQPGDSAQ